MLDELRSRPLYIWLALGTVFALGTLAIIVVVLANTQANTLQQSAENQVAAIVAGNVSLKGVAPDVMSMPTKNAIAAAAEAEVRHFTSLTLNPLPISQTFSVATRATAQLQPAKDRAAAMQKLAKLDPAAFLRNVIPSTLRSRLPSTVQAQVEQKATLTGTIEVLHIDDFSDARNSRFEYSLKVGTTRYSLYFAGNPPAMLSGSKIKVSGYQLKQVMVAGVSSATLSVLSTPAPDAVGTQNTLVILITASGLPATPTKEEMQSTIFIGAFAQYYEEQSYGKTTFVGDVTDWISVPASAISWCGAPDFEQPDVKDYIIQHGIDLSLYGRVMFVNNGQGGGCSFVGKSDNYFNGGTYRLSKGWTGFNGYGDDYGGMSSFEYVLAHEMGHGLGVMHANSWECSGPSLYSGCYHQEYGNSFDVMGNGYRAKHFNALYKDLLGWLATSSKVFITQSGTYTLAPLEAQSGVRAGIVSNPALLAIAPSTTPMYLEFRQPIGFDKFIPATSAGIFFNRVIPYYFPSPRLLNANYATTPPGQHALMPGGSFTDPGRGISVSSLSIVPPTSASFSVSIMPPVCQRNGLEFQNIRGLSQISVGSSGYFNFDIANNDFDACSSSEVTMSASISDGVGWTIYQYPEQPFTLLPQTSSLGFVSFYPPSDVTLGDRTLTVTLTDTTNSRTYSFSRTITVIPPPKIDSIIPASGLAGTPVTLSGSGFTPPIYSNAVIVTNNLGGTDLLYAYVWNLYPSSDTVQTFTFPTTMNFNDGGKEAPTSTPPGVYFIYLIRGGGSQSNSIAFEVVSVTPPPATTPSPTHGAQNQSTSTQLSWVSDAPRFDVYFGRSSTTPPYRGTQITKTYNPGTLLATTTYFWRINPANSAGTTTGSLWSFKTRAGTAIPGPSIQVLSPNGGQEFAIGGEMTISWFSRNLPVDNQICTYLINSAGKAFGFPKGAACRTNEASGQLAVSGTLERTAAYDLIAGEYHVLARVLGPLSTSGMRQILTSDRSDATIGILDATESHIFSKEFSSVQGTKGWYYQYKVGATYSSMTWVASTTRWMGDEPSALIFKGGLHPSMNSDAALAWVASKDGTVRIEGIVSDRNGTCGDGVLVTIAKNTSTLWAAAIANADTVGKRHDKTENVSTGDTIYFVVNKGSANNQCDGTSWNPTITYI